VPFVQANIKECVELFTPGALTRTFTGPRRSYGLYGLDQTEIAFIEASEKRRLEPSATIRGAPSSGDLLESEVDGPDEPS